MTQTRILIVEDELLVAKDLQVTLETWDFLIVGHTDDGEDAVRLVESLQPDLILMDVRLKGKMDGITAGEQIWQQWKIPLVYLTAYADELTLQRAKLSEPFGYILKPFEEQQLRATVTVALRKAWTEKQQSDFGVTTMIDQTLGELKKMFEAQRAPCVLQSSSVLVPPQQWLHFLTQREEEILRRLCSGDRVSMIARSLFISPHTVRNHLKAIFRKIGVGSQTELMEELKVLNQGGPTVTGEGS